MNEPISPPKLKTLPSAEISTQRTAGFSEISYGRFAEIGAEGAIDRVAPCRIDKGQAGNPAIDLKAKWI